MTVLFGITIIGTILYFLISICIPYKEDVEAGVTTEISINTKKVLIILGIIAGVAIIGALLFFVITSNR